MKNNASQTLKGFVEYKESTYPFFYENGLLNIIPGSEKKWAKEKEELFDNLFNNDSNELDWIPQKEIKGKLIDENEVIFSVSGEESNNNGFITFDVDSIFTYNPNFINIENISGIRIYGDEINYFLPPYSIYETEIKLDKTSKTRAKSLTIKAEINKVFNCGVYTYKDIEVSIRSEIIVSTHNGSHTPTSSKTQFKFDFSKPVNIDFIYDVILHCNNFFKYICSRTNINLDKYDILNEDKRKSGSIFFVKSIEKELNKNKDKQIIKYKYLNDKTADLFKIISGYEMNYEHLQSSISARNSYAISRIISIMVAFEREFRNIYSEVYKRSEIFYDTRSEVVSELNSLKEKNSGQKRKYINGFIGTISKSENSFSDKLKFAINDCFDILKIFFPYDYRQSSDYTELSNDDFKKLIETISCRMNKLRNDSAHGNIDLKIEPIDLKHLNTLENLLIAMRFKKIGISELNIKKSIIDLNGYAMSLS